MKLSDMAMGLDEDPGEEGGDDIGESAFKEAATDAFELWGKGKKDEAVTALKAAVEACVADYMSEDDAEPADSEE